MAPSGVGPEPKRRDHRECRPSAPGWLHRAGLSLQWSDQIEDRSVSPSIEEHRAELEQLCRRYRVVSLSLFGSATRDDFDPERSDYDFLVDFAGPTPTSACSNLWSNSWGGQSTW